LESANPALNNGGKIKKFELVSFFGSQKFDRKNRLLS
jgi:hypothetical protein